MKKFFKLLGLGFAVKAKYLVEFIRVVRRYWFSCSYYKYDLLYGLFHLWKGPYAVSREWLVAQGEKEIYTYGETPLTTLETIIGESGVQPDDLLFDLGCGSGQTSFFFHAFAGASVIALEQIPLFVRRAERIARWCGSPPVQFRNIDMLNADYSSADIIYYYGTCASEEFIGKLIARFRETLRVGARIVTVSWSLAEYADGEEFALLRELELPYMWGMAGVYVQEYRGKEQKGVQLADDEPVGPVEKGGEKGSGSS